nr:unnamed protein product [Callosobruchus chinensis]CAH7743092.1 unnamed protein product [Callosobruchus chinensis]
MICINGTQNSICIFWKEKNARILFMSLLFTTVHSVRIVTLLHKLSSQKITDF